MIGVWIGAALVAALFSWEVPSGDRADQDQWKDVASAVSPLAGPWPGQRLSRGGGWLKVKVASSTAMVLVGEEGPVLRGGRPWWHRQVGESCESYVVRYFAEGIWQAVHGPPRVRKAPHSYFTREPGGVNRHRCELSPEGSVPQGSEYVRAIFFSDFEHGLLGWERSE